MKISRSEVKPFEIFLLKEVVKGNSSQKTETIQYSSSIGHFRREDTLRRLL